MRRKIILGLISTFLIFALGTIVASKIYLKMNDSYEYYHLNMRMKKAWKLSEGENITIAILDSGLDGDLQKDFSENIVSPYNLVTDTDDIKDTLGHGSSIACVILCDYDTHEIYGIAPKANIMPIVVIDSAGRTDATLLSSGIQMAVDQGADIINVSLGSNAYNDDVLDAVNYAYDNGVYLIAAVGDSDAENVLYPAKYDNSIAVQAQSKLGVKYLDASYGPEVDVRIPGEFIKVLTYEETDIGKLVTKYESGSSYSVAIFSGVLALKLSYQENDFTQTFEYIRNIDINDKFINVEKFVKGS